MSAVEMNTVENAPVVVTPVMALLEQVKSLSFADLLAFNAGLAVHIKAEFKKVTKEAKKIKKEKDLNAPKRQLSAGMLAWKAFVKHLVATKPEMFVGITKAIQKMEIASEYKKEHMDDYNAFVASFVPPATNPETEVVTAVVNTVPEVVTMGVNAVNKNVTPVSEIVTTVTEVVTNSSSNASEDSKPKKKRAPKAADGEEKPKKVKEPKADGEDKPKKVKEPKADGEDKPKKKKAEPTTANPTADAQPRIKKIVVDDVTYLLITKTNAVYTMEEDESPGEEVGTYNSASNSIDFA